MMNTPPSPAGSPLQGIPLTDKIKVYDSEVAPYWLAAIVESADDAIISKTLDGVITSWNEGAQRLFGYTEEEAVGQPVTILIPPDHEDEEPEILEQIRRGRKVEHYETVRVHKSGRLLNISLTVSPIRAQDGTVIGASKIARDITAQKEAEVRLRHAVAEAEAARRQAEEASRLKDEFLSTISHELRTPLTSVLGWVTMLRSGRLDKAMVQKGLDTIERNVKAQAQLIEDLLDISRIVSGKMNLNIQPFNLSSTIQAAADSIMPAAAAKDIRLRVVLDPGTGPVLGDHDRLQQVIWNLLSNAIKFTSGGGWVQIQMEPSASGVEVTVSDNGVGISPEFLPHIFDRFAQQDSSSTRTYGGLGMGLAIVKYIMELHGGVVRASSGGAGQGASFTITLPRVPEKSEARVPQPLVTDMLNQSAPKPLPELAGLQILMVDDEIDTCEMVKTAFEQCGSTVRIATSATQALQQMAHWRPDVLIADINMPQEDGYQFIRQVREREAPAQTRIPAIALTAMARIEDRTKALRAGYQMHVAKPVELSELYAIVASLSSVVIKDVPLSQEI